MGTKEWPFNNLFLTSRSLKFQNMKVLPGKSQHGMLATVPDAYYVKWEKVVYFFLLILSMVIGSYQPI
jgi:hypothetical protein